MTHIHDINFLNIQGKIITTKVKKRTGRSSDNDGIKAATGYRQQYKSLHLDYTMLLKNDFFKNDNIFVGNFFPDELSDYFFNELFEQAGLFKIGESKISTNIFLTKIYFKIINLDSLKTYLRERIKELNDYISLKISKNDFIHKNIILWESFYMNDYKVKIDIINKNFDNLRIHIEAINKIEKGFFDNISNKLSLGSNVKFTLSDSDNLISDIIVDFSDIDDIDKVNNFISVLSQRNDIGAIRLDHFMSSIEDITHGGINQKINIDVVVPNNLPIVAVIDSGIAKNEITEKILINDGLDFTNNNNPFGDITGHGTAVGCIVAYGNLINEYFIEENIDKLIPCCKLFSVKVFNETNSNIIEYEELFKIGGELGKKVEQYNIKIINISFGARPVGIDGEYISKTASILDKFSNHYGVIFVVASGNIESKSFKTLLHNYNNFEFYSDYEMLARKKYSEFLNITTPSDLLSGISVGSLYDGRPAFHSRSYPKIKGAFHNKPDILSLGGGNYIIDDNNDINNINSVLVCNPTSSLMVKSIGTSFSTPRVTRLLSIANTLYPHASIELLKSLVLHKISDFKAKNDFIVGRNKYQFNQNFLGMGTYNTDNETDILKDGDDEITFTFQSEITSGNLVTFPLNITEWIKNNSIPNNNKLQLKLSICIMPKVSDTIKSSKDYNIFHISALTHVPGINVVYTKQQKNGNFPNQMIGGKEPGVIIPWTSDYMSNNLINLTYSEKSKKYTKLELKNMLGKSNIIEVSVRGICEKTITRKFGVVLSIKDLGASGQIRNMAQLKNYV